MATQEDITSAISRRDRFQIESKVFLPLVGEAFPLLVDLEGTLTTISPRQLERLERLLEVPADRLGEIQAQLFEHWEQYDHFYRDDLVFEYADPPAAFEACELCFIAISESDEESPDGCELRFSVEWDPEHGAGVLYHEGLFRWCP